MGSAQVTAEVNTQNLLVAFGLFVSFFNFYFFACVLKKILLLIQSGCTAYLLRIEPYIFTHDFETSK